jgi:ribonuclease P protein subunit RPR2
VETARKIAMSARLSMPQMYRRQMCKNCHMLLVPGETSRVRVRARREPHTVTTCLTCGAQTRIPLKTRNKEKTKVEQTINKQNETSR